ncbi:MULTISPECIES: hypothetical protein [Borreliella]|uniref:hypothetical protein n=1 Tax=Borreliella TaxID=64895 RepID=UPI00061A13AE|nr:hypothetical protein [Borreliella garinii]AJY73098.1 hypothetical protein BAFK78_AC019 [Borreliella afzelii K78]
MFKNFIVIICFYVSSFLYSNESNSLVKDFSRLAFPNIEPGVYVVNLVYEIYLDGVLKEKSKGFSIINSNNSNSCLVYTEGKKSDIAFLVIRDTGYFMLSSKSSNPIKVSPSYKVKGISSLQDIIGLRFEEDFSLLEKRNKNLLKFQSKKSSLYPFVDLIRYDSNKFSTLHKDRNSHILREVLYNKGFISGINAFSSIEVVDRIFENHRTIVYTKNFAKTNLNNSIFTMKGFLRVFDIAKNYLK